MTTPLTGVLYKRSNKMVQAPIHGTVWIENVEVIDGKFGLVISADDLEVHSLHDITQIMIDANYMIINLREGGSDRNPVLTGTLDRTVYDCASHNTTLVVTPILQTKIIGAYSYHIEIISFHDEDEEGNENATAEMFN